MSSTSAPPGGAPRKRRARGSISAQEILQGAYELASAESLDALSMPRLAQRLDVGVTSIYWYFRNKDELLDTLAERAMTEFDRHLDLPDTLPWDEYLAVYFRNHRRLFTAHDLLCDLIVLRSSTTPGAARRAADRIDRVLQVLVAAGFPPDDARNAYSALSVYTRGSAALARIAGGASSSSVGDDAFEFGLENTLRGLRAHLHALGSRAAEAAPTRG